MVVEVVVVVVALVVVLEMEMEMAMVVVVVMTFGEDNCIDDGGTGRFVVIAVIVVMMVLNA